MARKKEMRMNTLKFFLAGILGVNLLGVAAALPQATGNQAALARQSSIVFAGTVSQLGATSFADVPKSAHTIVVLGDSVPKKPSAGSLKKGDSVTVEVKDPSAFHEGTQATFYTDGLIFGSGVAVRELGHEVKPGGGKARAGGSAAGRSFAQMQQQISDQELRDRIASADFVVAGRITDVHPWKVPKSAAVPYRVTEHSPDWHEAVLQIQSTLKGAKVKKNRMVVRSPGSRDVAWEDSPRFEKHQTRVYFL